MLLTMLTYRLPNQRAVTVVNAWTVAGGSREIVRCAWDPEGRMTADEAVEASLRLCLHALEARRGRREGGRTTGPQDQCEGQLSLVEDRP